MDEIQIRLATRNDIKSIHALILQLDQLFSSGHDIFFNTMKSTHLVKRLINKIALGIVSKEKMNYKIKNYIAVQLMVIKARIISI